MPFRFRQFQVEDERSTLRVGTDAMLLGAWAQPGPAQKILDIGTGCGVLALMMAQQSVARIEAIDMDLPSVNEARRNFLNSPWSNNLSAIHCTLQEFSIFATPDYDLILTNPPYFYDSLKSPDIKRNNTRHENSLSLEELVARVNFLILQNGRFTLILPSEAAYKCCSLCQSVGLYLIRQTTVYPKPAAPPRRILLEFSKIKVAKPIRSELTILDTAGNFSEAYLTLTGRFHNF
jgi:tRNA1Val (adenine37-N6)-methyltransferase